MNGEDGPNGGASPSTQPAAGSSAATDVSLREYTSRDLWWLDRLTQSEINALRRETNAANANAEKAAAASAHEAEERLASHNGLIEQMRQQATEFARADALEDFKRERHAALDAFKDEADKRFGRLESFQSKLLGAFALALVVVPVVVAIITYLLTRHGIPVPTTTTTP